MRCCIASSTTSRLKDQHNSAPDSICLLPWSALRRQPNGAHEAEAAPKHKRPRPHALKGAKARNPSRLVSLILHMG
jgi:hypothetical protein